MNVPELELAAEPRTTPRRWSQRIANHRLLRDRVPPRYRPTLYLETLYNAGTGGLVSLFFLSMVVVKTVLGGEEQHLTVLASLFGGSSLLSPAVSWLGRRFSMRSVVAYPNFLAAVMLLTVGLPFMDAWTFTLVVGGVFVLRVFPRVGEMNMYRLIYPATHRSAAVGWLKAVSAISGLVVILLGYWWFGLFPQYFWVIYVFSGIVLFGSGIAYLRIPVSRRNLSSLEDQLPAHRAFMEGVRIFFRDRRFLTYQIGFGIGGTANQLALVFTADVLKDDLHASDWVVGLVVAVLPALLMTLSAPAWGRLLDRINPMTGRAIFNGLQCLAFAFYAYGGTTRQIWPFVTGAVLSSVSNGGGIINWLTGSLYFAPADQVPLYNAIHAALTGLRGLIAPALGLYLFSDAGLGLGSNVFWVASSLSLLGALVMLPQGLNEPIAAERK